VQDQDGNYYATRAVTLGPRRSEPIPIPITDRMVRLELVRPDSTPIANTFVALWIPEDPTRGILGARTDGEGLLELADFGSGQVALLTGKDNGPMSGEILVDTSRVDDPEEPRRVEIDFDSVVEIRFLENGEPAAQVPTALRPRGIPDLTANEGGGI